MKSELSFKKIFSYAPFVNVGCDVNGQYETGNKESFMQEMDKLHEWANEWFTSRIEKIQSVGAPMDKKKEIPPAFNSYEQVGTIKKVISAPQKDNETDINYRKLKAKIAVCNTKEEAQKVLDASEFRLAIDAKKYLESLFSATAIK